MKDSAATQKVYSGRDSGWRWTRTAGWRDINSVQTSCNVDSIWPPQFTLPATKTYVDHTIRILWDPMRIVWPICVCISEIMWNTWSIQATIIPKATYCAIQIISYIWHVSAIPPVPAVPIVPAEPHEAHPNLLLGVRVVSSAIVIDQIWWSAC